MPITKGAIKKVRVDARRKERNLAVESALKSAIKGARLNKTFAAVSAAYSALDKAVKRHLITRNFANRQKAQISKLAKPIKTELVKITKAKGTKKVTKKAAPTKKVSKKISKR